MAPPYTLTITNPGGEAGDTTGWTQDRGSLAAVQDGDTKLNGNSPHSGSYVLGHAGTASDFQVVWYQDLDPVADGASTTELDDGSLALDMTWWQIQTAADDLGTMWAEFLDGSGDPIEGHDSLPLSTTTPDTWEQRQLKVHVPSGTRTIRIYIHVKLVTGSVINSYLDDIAATLVSNNLQARGKRAWIVFRSTSESPPSFINEALGTTPSIADLNDLDGAATGWSLSTVSGSFNGANNTGGVDKNPILPRHLGNGRNGMRDTDPEINFRVGGLDPNKTYRLEITGMRGSTGDRKTDYTVDGTTITLDNVFNLNDTAEFTGVSPDGNGDIDIFTDVPAGADFGYWNSMEIEEETSGGGNGSSGASGAAGTVLMVIQ